MNSLPDRKVKDVGTLSPKSAEPHSRATGAEASSRLALAEGITKANMSKKATRQ